MFKILQDRVYGLESKQKLYNAAKGKYECYSAILGIRFYMSSLETSNHPFTVYQSLSLKIE